MWTCVPHGLLRHAYEPFLGLRQRYEQQPGQVYRELSQARPEDAHPAARRNELRVRRRGFHSPTRCTEIPLAKKLLQTNGNPPPEFGVASTNVLATVRLEP